MWKLAFVECHNFISFKDAELEIPQHSCTLIYGINHDNDQQKNNGTGKSSIIEAIAFGLTGESLRAVSSVEELINDYSDTAEVYLELENDYDGSLFIIRRTLSRKSAQVIECHKYNADDKEIEESKTVQPTVLDYNKFILQEIGLSKDDLYSSFILCKNRYKSFFDASDKTKKAMINKFSGADVVDKSIEELKKDMAPVEDNLYKAHDAVLTVESKINVIDQQLADSDNKKAEWEADKQARIGNINAQIASKRQELRDTKEIIKKANNRLDRIDALIDSVEEIGNNDVDMEEKYHNITALFAEVELPALKDYPALLVQSTNKIASIKKAMSGHVAQIEEAQKGLEELERQCKSAQTKFNQADSTYSYKTEQNRQLIQFLDEQMKSINETVKKNKISAREARDKADELDRQSRVLLNRIQSAIECPKCHHKFDPDPNVDIEKTKIQAEQVILEKSKAIKSAEKFEYENEGCRSDIEIIEGKRDKANREIEKCTKEVRELNVLVRSYEHQINSENQTIMQIRKDAVKYEVDITSEQGRIDGLCSAMINEAMDIIDNALDKGEAYVRNQQDLCVSMQSAIETFEKTLEEVKNSSAEDFSKSLLATRSSLEGELKTAKNNFDKVQAEYDELTVQANHFDEFKSHLANTKIEAISAISNHFLQLLGSDLRVEMTGYKKLKSGKIRDKITVNLLRNGIPCGSYARHSGGERARVNLASILGLQRLMNSTAADGKGLDLLIIDEVLESEDQVGIETTCSALNTLKVTSLMITQNPVVDTDGEIVTIVKENGFSSIIKKEQ